VVEQLQGCTRKGSATHGKGGLLSVTQHHRIAPCNHSASQHHDIAPANTALHSTMTSHLQTQCSSATRLAEMLAAAAGAPKVQMWLARRTGVACWVSTLQEEALAG